MRYTIGIQRIHIGALAREMEGIVLVARRCLLSFTLAALLAASCAWGQAGAQAGSASGSLGVSTPLSLRVLPTLVIPIGASGDLFKAGGGADLLVAWRLPWVPLVYAAGELGYLLAPARAPDTSVSAIPVGLQAGVDIQLSRAFSVRAYGSGGWYFAMLNGGGAAPGNNPFAGAGISASYDFTRSLGATLGGGYRWYGGLLSGMTASLGMTYRFESARGARALPEGFRLLKGDARGLDLAGIRLDPVFPVFFAYYDTHPIGQVIVRNLEAQEARDIKVSVLVKQFMDAPKEALFPQPLRAGAAEEVAINGLFSDRLLAVAEATKIPIEITLEYRQFGTIVREQYVETLSVFDRNAMSWDDDRKAAAFVSSKDPEVLRIARSISSTVKQRFNPALSQNLQTALAVHEGLRILKLSYAKDPSSALVKGSRNTVDFLQFPQQTLAFRTGDCDDLSILYCSILEALGIPTAFVTVPGHILMAIDLGVNAQEASRTYSRPADLIDAEGTVWLPIETTLRDGNFQEAWEEGARHWRENSPRQQAALYPVRSAWQAYPPVVPPGIPPATPQPEGRRTLLAFEEVMTKLVNQEIGPRVALLQDEIRRTGSAAAINKLGVLYARFGLFDKAEAQFRAAIKKQEIAGTLINLGNIAFLKGEYAESLSWYDRALKRSPDSAKVLVAIARTQAQLGAFDLARVAFERARAIDSSEAESYAFLGGTTGEIGRAAGAEEEKRRVEWNE